MATRVSHHNRGLLPEKLTPDKPSYRDHGMVSEYEAGLIMRSSPPFEISDDDLVVMNMEEQYPTLIKPVPIRAQQPIRLESILDPALCITPEKVCPRKTGKVSTQDLNVPDESPDQQPSDSQRVRFDRTVEVCHMSPDSPTQSHTQQESTPTYCDPHKHSLPLKMSSVFTPVNRSSIGVEPGSETKTYKYTVNEPLETHISEHRHLVDRTDPDEDDLEPKKIHTKDIPDVAKPDSSDETNGAVGVGVRIPDLGGVFDEAAVENDIARAEFHSILWRSRDLEKLQMKPVDSGAADIEKNVHLKNKVTEKATSKVNLSEPQYPQIASVTLSEKAFLEQPMKRMEIKSKSLHKAHERKFEDAAVPAPDIMDFFTPKLQKESASYNVDAVPHLRAGPCTAPLSRALDVYRHIRAWEGW